MTGAFSDGAFVFPVRVYYADTDAGGIVYHARYLDFIERARSELLRALGQPLVGADGAFFVIRRAETDWRAPALLDDLLETRTTVESVGAASVIMRQSVLRAGTPLFEARVTLAHVSAALRPARLPAALRAAFAGVAAG